jgi:UDP-glucose 4-epimerase
MSILITGGGLVASHAARALADAGERVVIYDISPSETYLRVVMEDRPFTLVQGDILDLSCILHVVEKEDVKGIIHTAALLPAQAKTAPYTCARVNIEGGVNLLEAYRLAHMNKFVYCSTIGVYDREVPEVRPWEEDHPIGPETFYGCTKFSLELIGLHYARAYEVDLCCLRFSAVFGLGQWYGSIGPAFMQKLVEGPALGQAAVVDKPFNNTSQYLYAIDAGTAVALSYKEKNPPERVFNISGGEIHEAKQVIETVKKVIKGARIEITPEAWEASKNRHFFKQPFSLNRARNMLGFEPSFSLERAIEHYAEMARARAREER